MVKPRVGLDFGHRRHTFPSNGKGVFKNGKGYAEFDYNEKVGLRLKELLEANGVEVVTQPDYADRPESLTGRTNFFNSQKVDILISKHANAGAPSASGRCVFYWHSSKDGKRLAELVRDEVKDAGYSTHGNGLHASQIGSWTNLHMVRETNMPTALTEDGFMTNAKDFELIFGSKQDEYVEDMAQANARAICRYFGIAYNGKKKSNSVEKTIKVEVKGAVSKVEPAKKGDAYTVKAGDTLSEIAEDFGTTAKAIAEANGIKNPDKINVGQRLTIPKGNVRKTYNITADGYMGPETVRSLQDYFGLVVDGEMWGQVRNQATQAFNQKAVRYGKGGSPVVKALQKKIGANVDGYWGANTTRALQRYLGTPVDGEIWRPSTAIKEMQRRLNAGTF